MGVDDDRGDGDVPYYGSITLDGDNAFNKKMMQYDPAEAFDLNLKGVKVLTFGVSSERTYSKFDFANATVTCTRPPRR